MTSALSPDGGPKSGWSSHLTVQLLARRVIDGLFRRWPLYLLPVVALGALGFILASSSDEYESRGTLFVQDETFLAQLTEVREEGLSFQTPATLATEQLWGLLQTDSFIDDVIVRADAGQDVRPQGATVDDGRRRARKALETWPGGQNFVTVAATWDDPTVARDLASAAIETLTLWQIETDLTQSGSAEEFFTELSNTYAAEVEEAQAELDRYLVVNPDPTEPLEQRPLSEVIAIDRLRRQVETAETDLADAREKSEDARLATAQAERDVRQAFLVIDHPPLPTDPETGPVAIALRTLLFATVGALASAAVLVLTALLDSSMRNPAEAEHRLGLDVSAVVRAKSMTEPIAIPDPGIRAPRPQISHRRTASNGTGGSSDVGTEQTSSSVESSAETS